MPTQTKEGAVRWFEIYVQNMDRARKFYETVFDRKLEKLNTPEMDYWAFRMDSGERVPGCGGALVQMKGVASGGGGTLVYFGCDDCAIEESRVKKAGGQVHRPKMSIGEFGFISLVVDTEGNMIGLHSMK